MIFDDIEFANCFSYVQMLWLEKAKVGSPDFGMTLVIYSLLSYLFEGSVIVLIFN